MHNEWSVALFKGDNMLFCYPVGKKEGRLRDPDKRRGCGGWGRRQTQFVVAENIDPLLILYLSAWVETGALGDYNIQHFKVLFIEMCANA